MYVRKNRLTASSFPTPRKKIPRQKQFVKSAIITFKNTGGKIIGKNGFCNLLLDSVASELDICMGRCGASLWSGSKITYRKRVFRNEGTTYQ